MATSGYQVSLENRDRVRSILPSLVHGALVPPQFSSSAKSAAPWAKPGETANPEEHPEVMRVHGICVSRTVPELLPSVSQS